MYKKTVALKINAIGMFTANIMKTSSFDLYSTVPSLLSLISMARILKQRAIDTIVWSVRDIMSVNY